LKQAAGRAVEPGAEHALSSARARQAAAAATLLEIRARSAESSILDVEAMWEILKEVGIELWQYQLMHLPASFGELVSRCGAPPEAVAEVYELVDDVVRTSLTRFADGAGRVAGAKASKPNGGKVIDVAADVDADDGGIGALFDKMRP